MTVNYAKRILERDNMQALRKWCESDDSDAARGLLRALIFGNKSTILVNLVNQYGTMNGHPLFAKEFEYLDESVADSADSIEDIIDQVEQINSRFCDETGEYLGPYSQTLELWVGWLRGSESKGETLMHAICARVWRDCSEDARDLLRGLALYYHAYMIYYKQEVIVDRLKFLSGSELDESEMGGSMCSDETCSYRKERDAHCEFGCTTRVDKSEWESCGVEVDEYKTFKTSQGNMPMMSLGDSGVAIRGEIDGCTVGYFLEYPEKYENGAQLMWELM